MADNVVSQGWSYKGDETTTLDALSQQVDDINKFLRGKSAEEGGFVSRNPMQITRGEIADVYKSRKATREALPDIFESYLGRISREGLAPDEAAQSYLDISRASGGKLSEAIKLSDKLRQQAPGMVAAERYDRYKPAASLAFSQLLGRPLGEQEYKNYVSAAQGLGISKGPDFQAFLGEALLSSPEYKSQAVIFDPDKVARGVQALAGKTPKTSLSDYASMLGTV
jgi:hypothetical protein